MVAPTDARVLAGLAFCCCAACGSSDNGAPRAPADGGADVVVRAPADSGTDAVGAADAADAGPYDSGQPADAMATGERIVSRPATLEGLTSDGYVIFSEPLVNGGRVAEVVALDGTGQQTIAVGTSTDKTLRIVVAGKVAFVWTDRGNRSATLTVWSKATGAVSVGTDIRPGRAAATADGTSIGYMSDVATDTANMVVSSIGAADAGAVVGVANASDPNCWRDVDMGFVGSATPRFLSFYCPQSSTSFGVQSTATDGSGSVMLSTAAAGETFGTNLVVVVGASGVLQTSAGDGTSAVTIASNAANEVLSSDQSTLVFQATDGSISSSPAAEASPLVIVPAGQAQQVGSVSADGRAVMFAAATSTADAGGNPPPTDVRVAWTAADSGAPVALESATSSCVNCLTDPFSPDDTQALAIDPIDTTTALAGSGPLRAFALPEGTAEATFGSHVWDAIALRTGSGTGSVYLIVEIADAPQLETGFSYDFYTRSLAASDTPSYVARAAENAAVDEARTTLVYSIPGDGNLAGVWVAPLP